MLVVSLSSTKTGLLKCAHHTHLPQPPPRDVKIEHSGMERNTHTHEMSARVRTQTPSSTVSLRTKLWVAWVGCGNPFVTAVHRWARSCPGDMCVFVCVWQVVPATWIYTLMYTKIMVIVAKEVSLVIHVPHVCVCVWASVHHDKSFARSRRDTLHYLPLMWVSSWVLACDALQLWLRVSGADIKLIVVGSAVCAYDMCVCVCVFANVFAVG